MELYRSIAKVDKLGWDWSPPATPMSAASDLAQRMTLLPKKSLLSADGRIDQPDGELVAQLLSSLIPENMNVGLILPASGAQSGAADSRAGSDAAVAGHAGGGATPTGGAAGAAGQALLQRPRRNR